MVKLLRIKRRDFFQWQSQVAQRSYSGVTHCQKFKLLYVRNEKCFVAGNLYKDLFSIYLQPNVYKNS